MTRITNDPLLAIAKIIVLIGQAIMAVALLAITIGLPIVLFMQGQITEELRAEFADPNIAFPVLAVVAILLLAAAIVVMAFQFLRKLRHIIDTVGDGDPFVPENAERLTTMAWLMLAIQALAIPAAGLALYITKILEEQDATIDAGFDLNGIILVIMLFILARVFRHGTAIRDDLEGTV